jgi:hypothetical protein
MRVFEMWIRLKLEIESVAMRELQISYSKKRSFFHPPQLVNGRITPPDLA